MAYLGHWVEEGVAVVGALLAAAARGTLAAAVGASWALQLQEA